MINRDFNKSNKDYFNKNKIALIAIAVFLLIGIVITAIFGMNGNFEFKGSNEFSVRVSYEKQNEYNTYQKQIVQIVNAEGGNVDNVSISGQGDNTKIVVRYMNNLSTEVQLDIENKIIEKLAIDASAISDHVKVAPTVKAQDFIYTATAILLLVVIATMAAWFRYNSASAIAIILECVLGTLAYISLGSILRLTIGMSYFAMLALLNLMIIYLSINVFEVIRDESWMATKDYASAIQSGLAKTKFRTIFVVISVFAIGLLFALIAPNAIKYVSLNIMFLAVALLAVIWYVLPFVWSVLITKSRIKLPKKKETKKEIEEN